VVGRRADGVTTLLSLVNGGDEQARNDLLDLINGELHDVARALMQRERRDHTLTPTALANEAVVRLIDEAALQTAENRAHLFGMIAQSMRQVLVRHAKDRTRLRRGGGWQRHAFDDVLDQWAARGVTDFVRFDELLHELGRIDERQRVVIELRFVLERSVKETAAMMGVSERTVELETKKARAWLFAQLEES